VLGHLAGLVSSVRLHDLPLAFNRLGVPAITFFSLRGSTVAFLKISQTHLTAESSGDKAKAAISLSSSESSTCSMRETQRSWSPNFEHTATTAQTETGAIVAGNATNTCMFELGTQRGERSFDRLRAHRGKSN
jgi:hypothetical protein